MYHSRQALIPLLLLGLTACGDLGPPPPPKPEAPAPGANGPVATDRPLATDEVRTPAGVRVLPAGKRLIVLAGHVAAGVAMYRAGDPASAMAQLSRMSADTSATEREGFDTFGYDSARFTDVIQAAETALPPGEAEPALQAAEAHLASLLENTGLAPVDQILFLLELCGNTYGAGVMDAAIRRPLAYQAAYGYAVLARDTARNIEGGEDLLLELEILVRMWPDQGPVKADAVAPEPAIGTQLARARLAASIL